MTIENQSNISRASKGGARIGAGRKKGVPNKIVREVRELAQGYGEQAIEVLADLMSNAQSESTKVMAVKELLDRAYGKPTSHSEVTGKDGKDLIAHKPLLNISPDMSPQQIEALARGLGVLCEGEYDLDI